MIFLIWLFSISGLLIIIMISYRYYEVVKGCYIIPEKKKAELDESIKKYSTIFYDFSVKQLNISKKKIKKLPILAHGFLHKIWIVISSKIDKYFDKLHGENRGGKKKIVSLYWQKGNSVEKDKNKPS